MARKHRKTDNAKIRSKFQATSERAKGACGILGILTCAGILATELVSPIGVICQGIFLLLGIWLITSLIWYADRLRRWSCALSKENTKFPIAGKTLCCWGSAGIMLLLGVCQRYHFVTAIYTGFGVYLLFWAWFCSSKAYRVFTQSE